MWYKHMSLYFDSATLEAVKVDVSEAGHRDTKPSLVCLTSQGVKVAEPMLSKTDDGCCDGD